MIKVDGKLLMVTFAPGRVVTLADVTEMSMRIEYRLLMMPAIVRMCCRRWLGFINRWMHAVLMAGLRVLSGQRLKVKSGF